MISCPPLFHLPSKPLDTTLPAAFLSVWLGLILALGNTPADAKGIHVRFLPNPAEDSIIRYQVLRAEGPGLASAPVGEIAALPLADTLGFPDSSAAKGKPYAYSIKAINAQGGVSDPSGATVVGYPALALPDTLRPDKATGQTRFVIPAASDPLRGLERMVLTLQDSTRFTLAFDSATHTAIFRTRSGRADSGWAKVSAQYFGKFADQDSVLLIAGMEPPASLGGTTWDGPAGRSGESPGLSGPPAPLRLWQGRDVTGRLLPAAPRL
jgi:hypothetical protein